MKRKKEQVREDVVKEEVKAKNKPDEKYDRGNEVEPGRVKPKWEVFEESVDYSQEESVRRERSGVGSQEQDNEQRQGRHQQRPQHRHR